MWLCYKRLNSKDPGPASSLASAGPIGVDVKSINLSKSAACLLAAASFLAGPRLTAQNLTLEGQTGGFITPTAYVVYSAKKHFF